MSDNKFDSKTINLATASDFNANHINTMHKQIISEKNDKEKNESEYKLSVLNALHGIEKNTALLAEMTLLLQKNNKKQEEVFELLIEILAIMKSSSNEEAENKYTTVMKKITTFTDNANTVKTLVNIAQNVFNVYQALPL